MNSLVGQSIGRYHIREQLGEGGMAVVYKAFDTRLERDVAIKIIRRDAFPPEQLEMVLQRFEREAKSLARMSHPNIVKVLDYGEYEGSPYLILEYLSGGTLKERMGCTIPWREAVRLLLPVARALSYAHQQGIVHRDVKPANVLMTQNNEPMLTDFGIAKILDIGEGRTLTGSGVGIGTPDYMAPEQGMGSKIDARADIYSLGIIFYELVTGRKPYVADTPMAIVLKHMTDPLPRPTNFVPSLPEFVENVIIKALAKAPEDRYANMGEVVIACEKLLVESTRIIPQSIETATVLNVEQGQAQIGVNEKTDIPTSWQTIEEAARQPTPAVSASVPLAEEPRLPAPTPSPIPAPGRKRGLPVWIWGVVAGLGVGGLLVGAIWLLPRLIQPKMTQVTPMTPEAAASVQAPVNSATQTLTAPHQPSPSAQKNASTTDYDRATFLIDVSVPDGTAFTPGATFNKTWRLKNTGTSNWTTDYRLVFSGGEQMSGTPVIALPRSVPPGQSVDLTVTLTAPAGTGSYRGFWKLQNPQGAVVTVEGVPSNSIFVDIKVQAMLSTPSVLYDDFLDEKSGWAVQKDEKGEMGYQNGNFRIAFYKQMGFHAAWSPKEYANFVVETAFNTPANVSDVGAGLTLRTAPKRWYLFWVYPAKNSYIFIKDIDGKYNELVPLTRSKLIQPLTKDNRLSLLLKVEARDDKFDLWVAAPGSSYQYLDTVVDSALTTGYLGPSADCPDRPITSPIEVFFEWFRITE